MNKRLIATVATVILVLVGAALFFSYQESDESTESEILFTIEGVDYVFADIEQYVSSLTNRGIEEGEAIEAVRQSLVYKYIAETYDIEYEEGELRAILAENEFYDEEEYDTDEWAKLFAKRIIIEQQVVEKIENDRSRQGYIFAYFFGSLIEQPDADTEQEGFELPDGMGDENKIAEDREYSRNVAERHRNQLISDEITPEEIIDEILADERLHQFYVIPANRDSSWSRPFGFNEGVSWPEEVAVGQQVDFIQSFNDIDQPSEIQVGVDVIEGEIVEKYYYFVDLVSVDQGTADILAILERNEVAI